MNPPSEHNPVIYNETSQKDVVNTIGDINKLPKVIPDWTNWVKPFSNIALVHAYNPVPILAPGMWLNHTSIMESSLVRSVAGLAMGSAFGVMMGLFLGAMGDLTPVMTVMGKEVPHAPVREQFRQTYRMLAARSISWGKNFAVMSALFAGTECVVEKARGKIDILNGVISGCTVGATLGIREGIQGACLGCVGFATFSVIIDKLMH